MAMILGNYIDGRRVAPRAGATFTKHNPADVRDIIGEFPASNAIEVRDAVSAAQRARSRIERMCAVIDRANSRQGSFMKRYASFSI